MCSTINMPIVYTVYYLTVILTLFLTNPPLFNTPPLPVLTRHGQSEYNAIGRIGGDSGLSGHGVAYAKALGDFVAKKVSSSSDGVSSGQGKDMCICMYEYKIMYTLYNTPTTHCTSCIHIQSLHYTSIQIIVGESGQEVPARLWTSTLRRTKETGQFIPQTKLILK